MPPARDQTGGRPHGGASSRRAAGKTRIGSVRPCLSRQGGGLDPPSLPVLSPLSIRPSPIRILLSGYCYCSWGLTVIRLTPIRDTVRRIVVSRVIACFRLRIAYPIQLRPILFVASIRTVDDLTAIDASRDTADVSPDRLAVEARIGYTSVQIQNYLISIRTIRIDAIRIVG